MSNSEKKLDTLCIHAGQTIDPATGAVMPPIYTSTTFEHEAFGQAGAYAYSRGANPTRGALERCVAELEGGARGFAYASGMAATAAVLELLAAGSHVITQRGIYGGTLRLFNQVRRHSAGLDFETEIYYKPDAAERFEAELRAPGYRCTPITLGANTDPYQPDEKQLGVTRALLKVALRYNQPLSIITKGSLIDRDLRLVAANRQFCDLLDFPAELLKVNEVY